MAKKHKADVKKFEPEKTEVETVDLDMSGELFGVLETPDMPDGAVPPVDVHPVYVVPRGSALSCRTRIVAEGEIVTADMVIGGQETINRLAAKGALVTK